MENRVAGLRRSTGTVVGGLTLLLISGCGQATGSNSSPSSSGSSSSSASGSSSVSGELTKLAEQWQSTSAKVSYQYSSGTASNGTFTLFWMPPSSSRFDITNNGQTSTMISVTGASYVCASSACIKEPASTGAAALPFFSFFSSPTALSQSFAALNGVQIQKSSQTIAGENSECFTVSASAQGAGEYCFTSNGVITLLKGSSGTSSYTMQATAISTSVSAADFQPPYPVTSIPGYPTP